MRARFRPSILLLAGCLLGGCRCRCAPGRDSALETQTFGAVSSASVDLGAFLSLARAAVTRGDRSKVGTLPQLAGRRVIVTLHPVKGARVRGSGNGASLADAVVAAAESIPQPSVPSDAFRIQIDALTLDEPVHFDEEPRVEPHDLGLDGYALLQKDASPAWIAPAEVLGLRAFKTGKQYTVSRDKLFPLLATRAGTTIDALKSRKAYRFRVQSVVEASPGQGAAAVTRGWADGLGNVTQESLLAATTMGADYLCRVLSPVGKYIYLYRTSEDRDDPSYGNLRHAGTTYALLEAYEELKNPTYLQKAETAIGYLRTRLSHETDASGAKMSYLIDGPGEEQQKVGGAGLAMIALAKRYRAKHASDPTGALVGPDPDLEEMRELGRFIVHAQYPDGHFKANADVERETGEKRKVKKEVIYYTGEAILGLMRLYALDPDPNWLQAAKKGADFVAKVRDAGLSEAEQEHDHWMSYALNELDRKAPDPAYVAHAWKIARSIRGKQWTKDNTPSPDYLGSFYGEAPSTPASTRLEAYDADIQLARYLGEKDDWLVGPAKEMAAFILAQQFDDVHAFAATNAEKAKGGVRESAINYDIRIDYVQHAMSSWIHLARILRDPTYGK